MERKFKIPLLGAIALLACVMFGAMSAPTLATAQTVREATVDPTVVQPGAELVAPSADPVRQYETRYSNDASDDGVELPWGDFLAELLQLALLGLATAAAFLLRKLPKAVVDVIDAISRVTLQKNASEFLELALGYGVNTTADAVRGKTMPITIASDVVERAVEYSLRHAPGLVAKMGGLLRLREKLIARLDLDPAEQFTAARPAITEPLTIERVAPATT